MTRPSALASSATAFSRNRSCSEPGAIGPSLIRPRARPSSARTKAACSRSNSSTGAELTPSNRPNFERLQESGRGHPEVVAHQQEGLQAQPVALAQGAHQLAVDILGMDSQPLLELVEDQQDLRAAMRRRRGRAIAAVKSSSSASPARSGNSRCSAARMAASVPPGEAST